MEEIDLSCPNPLLIGPRTALVIPRLLDLLPHYPVNPKATTLEGLPMSSSISAVPVRPNLVSVYLPPAVLLKVLPEIAAKGCDELWLNPGAESPEVLSEAERLGLNVVQACSIVGVGLSPSQL
jgi:predicted CoA-binding protein